MENNQIISMKSAVIFAVCTGLISCASISVPSTVGSPYTQQLLPQLNLNLPFSQAPQTNQLPQLSQVPQTNQLPQLSQVPQTNQLPQLSQVPKNAQNPRYNNLDPRNNAQDLRYNNNLDPRISPAQNTQDLRYNNQDPRFNPSQNNQDPRYDNNRDPRYNNDQRPIQRNYPRQQFVTADDEYVFSWKWACRAGISFADGQGKFYWNDQLVANIIPSDYNVHTATYNVKARNGINKLRIEGSGVPNGYGLTIDDVSIVKKGSNYNYVINGDFETPNQQNGRYGVFTNPNGWTGQDIIIGKGTLYNAAWTSQVCQLDGLENSLLSQDITLKVQSAPKRGDRYGDNDGNDDYNCEGCNCQRRY